MSGDRGVHRSLVVHAPGPLVLLALHKQLQKVQSAPLTLVRLDIL